MKLKLGKMTGKEIAEWLTISYDSTYRRNPTKQIEKLNGYCEYEQIRGGVIIKKIYTDTYYGELEKDTVKEYLQEIKNKKNKLSSIAGLTRKLQTQTKYQEIKFETLKYQLKNAAIAAFGKINRLYAEQNKGAYGSRYQVWAIKLDDYNNYRFFSKKEQEVFNEIITEFYNNLTTEDIALLGILDSELKEKKISVDRYFELKEYYGLDFFSQCIKRFKEKTGLVVAKAQWHDVQQESAFEEKEMRSLERSSQTNEEDISYNENTIDMTFLQGIEEE